MGDRIRLKKWAEDNNISYAQARRWTKCGKIKSTIIGRSIFVLEDKIEESNMSNDLLKDIATIVSGNNVLVEALKEQKQIFLYLKEISSYLSSSKVSQI